MHIAEIETVLYIGSNEISERLLSSGIQQAKYEVNLSKNCSNLTY